MNRRDLLGSITAGAAAALRMPAQAQAPNLPTIGLLSPNSEAVGRPLVEAFTRRLRELGWAEGRTVTIAYRWGDGRSDRSTELVDDLVRLKADVIVTHGVPYILAAKRAAPTTPIVFPLATDPVGSGFVASLSRPEGMLTGLSIQSAELGGKRLQLMRESVPGLRSIAILGDPGSALETAQAEAAARALGVEALTIKVEGEDEIAPALAGLGGRADALYVCAVPLFNTHSAAINALALAAKLPTMYGFREAVETGALMSYGPRIPDLFRRSADYVDKILRGAKPADIPVEQPTAFYLVVNLRTAKSIAVNIPPTLLARADEVIE